MTSDGKYFELTPEMSGSTVKFVCPSGTVDCGVGLASGGTCKNQLVTKESSNWNKEEYNAAMIGPEHNPKAVYTLLKANGWYKADLNKDSASAENYDDFNFPKPKEGSISECLKISSETKLKLSASSEYWGENCFYMDETNSNEYGWSVVGSGVNRKLVITKEIVNQISEVLGQKINIMNFITSTLKMTKLFQSVNKTIQQFHQKDLIHCQLKRLTGNIFQ